MALMFVKHPLLESFFSKLLRKVFKHFFFRNTTGTTNGNNNETTNDSLPALSFSRGQTPWERIWIWYGELPNHSCTWAIEISSEDERGSLEGTHIAGITTSYKSLVILEGFPEKKIVDWVGLVI